jgi:hypothetical protein
VRLFADVTPSIRVVDRQMDLNLRAVLFLVNLVVFPFTDGAFGFRDMRVISEHCLPCWFPSISGYDLPLGFHSQYSRA